MRVNHASIHADAFGDDGRLAYFKQEFSINSALPGGTNFTISGTQGVTAVTSGNLTFTAGGSGGSWVKHAGVYPVAGHSYVRAKVSSWSAGNDVFVGMVYDPPAGNGLGAAAGYRAGVVVTGATGQANLAVTFNGSTQTLLVSSPVTISSGDEVAFVLAWPEMWGWVKPASTGTWTCIGEMAYIAAVDLRATDQIQAWQPSIGGNLSASGSVSFASWQCGYGGGYGTRDYKWFVNKDGSPFSRSGQYYALTTQAAGNDFQTNHAAVCAIDPMAGTIQVVSHLFYHPAGTSNVTTSLYGGCVTYDAASDTYTILTNGWGYETQGTGVNEWVATITGDGLFTNPVNVLAATQLIIATDSTLSTPIGKSVYDGSAHFDSVSGLWWMVAPETNTQANWSTYYPTLYKGTSLQTLYRASQDAASSGEGANLVKIGGAWYAIFSRNDGNWLAYDVATWTKTELTNWNNLGAISITAPSTYCSHMAVLPINEGANTRYYGIGFDDTLVKNAGATKGQLFTMRSDEAPAGNEWPSSLPVAPTITSPATATATVGVPFTYQIAALGSPASFGLTGTLPSGLTFDASTGLISGTPTYP